MVYMHIYKKKSILSHKNNYQSELLYEINSYKKEKLKLLNTENIDLDYLQERSYSLGKSPKGSFSVKILVYIKQK